MKSFVPSVWRGSRPVALRTVPEQFNGTPTACPLQMESWLQLGSTGTQLEPEEQPGTRLWSLHKDISFLVGSTRQEVQKTLAQVVGTSGRGVRELRI
jgi:hypothetical protein